MEDADVRPGEGRSGVEAPPRRGIAPWRDELKGTLLAALTVGTALLLPEPAVVPFLALLLVFAAAVYVGFAELDPGGGRRRLQWAVALAFVAVALLGLQLSPWFLAAGWILHAGWDLLHHRGTVPTRTSAWYPGACLAYDLVVGGFLALWLSTPA